MRLSLIIELLIIFLLLAFAASRVIDPGDNNDYPRKLSSTSNTSQRQTAVVDGNTAAAGAPVAAEPPVAAETSVAAENPVAAEQKPASTNATKANETTTEEPPTEAPQAADEETSQQAEAVAAVQEEQQQPTSAKPTTPKPASPSTEATTSTTPPPQRACTCEELTCSCCREFPRLPLLRGPACAKLTYHDEDEMSLALTFGRRVLHNTTIKGDRPKPVCANLLGGVSQFCARVYGITRRGQPEDYFRACLGFEIRTIGEVEAAIRVSCFKFGPKGLDLEPAPAIPPDPPGLNPDSDDYGDDAADDEDEEGEDEEGDDDDDDDDIGFGDDDDDEEQGGEGGSQGEDDDDDDDFFGDDDDDDDDEGGGLFGGDDDDYRVVVKLVKKRKKGNKRPGAVTE